MDYIINLTIMFKNCLRCGKRFHFYPFEVETRKYCSIKCRDPYIIKKCLVCGKSFNTYPCRVRIGGGKYCSKICANSVSIKNFRKAGEKYRYKKGQIPFVKLHPEFRACGNKYKTWKGNKVGYRGLHYWLRRINGIPIKCIKCGKERTTPKSIQWANIDHKYNRNPNDYIPLCAKCHKRYDLQANPMSIFRS